MLTVKSPPLPQRLTRNILLYLPSPEIFQKAIFVCKRWKDCFSQKESFTPLSLRDFKEIVGKKTYLARLAFQNPSLPQEVCCKTWSLFQRLRIVDHKIFIKMDWVKVLSYEGQVEKVYTSPHHITAMDANARWLALGHEDSNDSHTFLTLRDLIRSKSYRLSLDNFQYQQHMVSALHFLESGDLAIGFHSGKIARLNTETLAHSFHDAHTFAVTLFASSGKTLFSVASYTLAIKVWEREKCITTILPSGEVTTMKTKEDLIFYGTKKGVIHCVNWMRNEELFSFESCRSEIASFWGKHISPAQITSLDIWPEGDILAFSETDTISAFNSYIEVWDIKYKKRLYSTLIPSLQTKLVSITLVKNSLYLLNRLRDNNSLMGLIRARPSTLQKITFSPFTPNSCSLINNWV